ncbi:MAG: chemotaxis protein CheD [Fusobacteriaceae bacterium]|jgi:chemotaxis protein CheD|nr:chemotaxis protein CheD [Fusobacteriaceae bacterium]
MENNVIKVGMADYRVGSAPAKLITLGLGSCIGITLYDKRKKAGGMAHIMLPKNNTKDTKSLKFADTALALMIEELEKMGLNKRNMEAKIAGGAQMFSFGSSDQLNSIGTRNAIAVKEILKENNIKIIAEDTGGNKGRTIELDLDTGKLRIKTIGQGETYI